MTAAAASPASPAVPAAGGLAPRRADPRAHWPEHARRLSAHLAALYGEDDVLPVLAGGWIASQRSVNTQRSYARGFKVFEEFAREHGTHPLAVKFPLADAFRLYLQSAPTWRPVKGGGLERTGEPYSDNSRAAVLSAASSFFDYLDKVGEESVRNPFDAVARPVLDPDFSPTPGYTEQEWAALVAVARDHHRAAAYRRRAYALLLVLYTCCLRIDSLLNARVEDLGQDKGHRVLQVRTKGGGRRAKAVPPVAWAALSDYLDGRTEGWLFCTASGNRLDEPAVWRLLQSLARRAGLPLRGPHGVKGDAVTHALARPDARPDKVQRWAEHASARTTQRYNRRKELLDDSPGYALGADLAGALQQHGQEQ